MTIEAPGIDRAKGYRSALWLTVDRYLFLQGLLIVLFSVVLFSVVWLAPETLFKLTQYVFDKNLPAAQAALMLLCHIPGVLQQTIPMAALLGSVFLFRRLSLNSELVALFGAGLSPWRVMRPVILVGVVAALCHGVVQEWVVPHTGPVLSALYRRYQLSDQKDDHFTYVQKNRHGQLEKFFLIGNTLGDKLSDFIILYYTQSPGKTVAITRILRAPSGYWDEKNNVWVLVKGIDYELDNEGVFRAIHRFDEQWVHTTKHPARLLAYQRQHPLEMSYETLRRYTNLLAEGGQTQDLRNYQLRLIQKCVVPLTAIVFVVLGAFLGMERARASRHLSLTFAALILFCYGVSIPLATNLGNMGLIPPVIAVLLPMVLASLVTWILLKTVSQKV